MDSSEQRRKRKRFLRTSAASPTSYFLVSSTSSYLFSVRSLLLCFCFFTFLYLLSYSLKIHYSVFRPVLVVSSLSLLSSSTDSVQDFDKLLSVSFKIEDRILFPDHVLLLVKNDGIVKKNQELDCVYGKRIVLEDRNYERESLFAEQNVLSVDEYDEFRLIVRCPLPPMNYSAVVNLERRGRNGIRSLGDKNGLWRISNQSVNNWDNVTYTATLDGDTAVVFVKGLNLRQERESDPRQFSCHFGLGSWESEGKSMLMTKAVTAAQEVVRCLLPRSIKKAPEKALGIRVTIGVTPHVHARAHEHVVLLPSVAKVFSSKYEGRMKNRGKYELCVCTMLWNQASALREWIMYHAWLGVERWFIYDNNSDDNIKEVIQELEQENYNVTRHVWPWIKTQEAGFSHCALRAKDECSWVSFMDVDEFFYFPYSTPKHKKFRTSGYAGQNSLRTMVANVSSSPRIAEIRTTCHSFGPSGLSKPPTQGITAGYTCRLQSPERHKSIIRPEAVDNTLLNVVHHFHLKKGFKYMNLPQSTAVINHYKYQVWDVFKAKFYRRVATYVADWQENHNEGSRDRAPGLGTEAIEPPNWSHQFCEVWDSGLRDFVLANLVDASNGLLPWETSVLDQ
ncbi:hypothetical protein ACH5RR_035716 [Cinchona calisaya]|uniref:Glycosyltransferase family 92 protein n=1 Tax=Cinchona calisaya TaxID=153742 RepID=A0ABD2Y112_9GENT